MSDLTDAQLEERIRLVEAELRKLGVGDGEPSAANAAVLRQLDMLDYLIDHPDATLPPMAALDAIDDERYQWPKEFQQEP